MTANSPVKASDAKGVESRQQLDFLSRIGCDRAQGFLIAHALTATDLERRLRGGQNEMAIESVSNHAAMPV